MNPPAVFRCLFFCLLAGSVATGSIQAQLVISEVCTKNNGVLVDGFGDTPDWIEVQNIGSTAIDLSDYYLSDDINDPGEWQLPDEGLAPSEVVVFYSNDDNSGDHYFPFKIERNGETIHLANSTLQVVQSIPVPYLHADHSFGLLGAGSYFFADPTPNVVNNTTGYNGYASDPSFSEPIGFHSIPIQLTLNAPGSSALHYTIDGSDPSIASAQYSGAIQLDTAHVVKAIAIGDSLLPSAIALGTFIINAPTDLPVVSISTHPDSLFDPLVGIYMLGPNADSLYPHWGANFWQDHDIPAYVEFYDTDGIRKLVQKVDLETHGGSVARNKPQRPLRMTARKEYGNDVMPFAWFPERHDVAAYRSIVLRNSGADFCISNFRDGLFHQMVLHNKLDVDVLGFRPAVVYINGAYWGIMEIRERIDPEHLHHNYGADLDDLLLMEEENLSIQGDTIHFRQLLDVMLNNDMNDPAVFAQVEAQLDVASFKDYFSMEIFAGNADWPANNLKYWKPSATEGKWRYLMYDLDATMNLFGWLPMDIDGFERALYHYPDAIHSAVFQSMLENDEFTRTFLNRLADLMNTAYTTSNFMREVDRITSTMENDIEDHFARWDQWFGYWPMHTGTIIPEFAAVRPGHVRNHVLQHFNLPNTATLQFEVFPPMGGDLTINTIRPGLPFEGVYFNGNAIDLTAHAAEGYVFDHWAYSEEDSLQAGNPELRKSFPTNGTVTAYFRSTTTTILAFPNPFSTNVILSMECATDGTLEVIVTDAQGREVHRSTVQVTAGVNRLDLPLDQLPAGVYTVRTSGNGGGGATHLVKLDR